MKWISIQEKRRLLYDNRKKIIKKFLFIPLCIKGEWRWLETVYIEKELKWNLSLSESRYYWKNKSWSNKVEETRYGNTC